MRCFVNYVIFAEVTFSLFDVYTTSLSTKNNIICFDLIIPTSGKTSIQLREMYKGIQKKLTLGGPIDVPYWESVAEKVIRPLSIITNLLLNSAKF